MLEIRNLCVTYGRTPVVEDVSLTLGADEILMLVGPTGCGKTTILRAIAGLVPISSGEIRLGELHIDAQRMVPPEKRNVGMVFQDFALFPHMTVEQNVAFRLADKTPADHWLRLLGLEPLRRVMPGNLSGGQKQRVALARSLAHKPALILLDEPLSNLDAALKDSLRWEIREALKTAGVPAIWVTHDQEEALSVGDRVGILNGGHLEQLDPPETCFCEPVSRFVARFLGEAAFLPGRLEEHVVHTAIGAAPATPMDGASGEVDLLVRPDDLSIKSSATGNARVERNRYEGGSRLYAVRLNDGPLVEVRASHETHFQVGDRVALSITTTHPLAAFKRDA
ncbi:ABC transporter ATP-binding protein [Gilvimarinus sp. F26214L]|uniref:ABC transporter ATP-binding protein n=1 Tax=Gilvimarinus sp. DZF01 TaxID=3461371 RepID=UPI0040468264